MWSYKFRGLLNVAHESFKFFFLFFLISPHLLQEVDNRPAISWNTWENKNNVKPEKKKQVVQMIMLFSSFVNLVWSSVLTGVSAGHTALIHQAKVHWEHLNDSWGCDWTKRLSVTFKTTNHNILLFHPVATDSNYRWEDFFSGGETILCFSSFFLLKKCCPAAAPMLMY